MTLFRVSLIVLTVGIIQACSSPKATTSHTEMDNPVHLSQTQATPLAPTFVMKGLVTIGHETRSFTPCGSNQQYWLDLDSEAFKRIMSLSQTAYQPMYAELIGHLEQTSPSGFDNDFVARFVVTGVNFVTVENINRCGQPYRSTKAFGNEPSWSIEFGNKDARFKQLGEQEQSLYLSSKQLTPNERKYYFQQEQLTISKTYCSDSMSESLYGWDASFVSTEEDKKGCAILSNFDSTTKWARTYMANSTLSTGFSIKLELAEDHTAATSYIYSEGLPTKEFGYWQQLNEYQVQVVMTRHQGQRLIAERIYTLEDDKIVTMHEKISGRLFPIANGGLTLYTVTP